jgi:hypothetical protein
MDATSSTELIEGINNAWVGNLNGSIEFWWWIGGAVLALFVLGLILGAMMSLAKLLLK